MRFILSAPLSSFPSDNLLDSMPRRERIAIKKVIKSDARILTLKWMQINRIHPKSLSKKNPLFRKQVRVVLTTYLQRGKQEFDIHNLSIKSFLDQIVAMGVVTDDSIKYIPESVARFGGYTRAKSYAEFSFEEMQ